MVLVSGRLVGPVSREVVAVRYAQYVSCSGVVRGLLGCAFRRFRGATRLDFDPVAVAEFGAVRAVTGRGGPGQCAR